MLQMVLGTICSIFLFVALALAARAVMAMVRIIRTGQPAPGRATPVGKRLKVLASESLRSEMASRGLEQAARFSWDRMAEQVATVYRDVVATQRT